MIFRGLFFDNNCTDNVTRILPLTIDPCTRMVCEENLSVDVVKDSEKTLV